MRLHFWMAALLTVAGCQNGHVDESDKASLASRQAATPSANAPTPEADTFTGYGQKTRQLLLAVNAWKAKPDGEEGTFDEVFQTWSASLSDREKRYVSTAKVIEAIDLFRRAKVAQRLSEENAGKADNSPLPESKAILALSMKYADESELLAMQAEKLLLEVRYLLDAGEAANLKP